MKKLCIFDLDGTLLNTLDSIAYYVNDTMKHFGLPVIETEKIRTFVGNGAKNLISRSLRYNGSKLDAEKVLSVYIEKYNSDALYLVKPYEGIPELLSKLRENGVTLAVLSNKPHSSTSIMIDKIFGKDLFSVVRGPYNNEKVKPDPAVANEIAKGFEKENCFFIGDSDVDIKTGRNALMHTIGVTWGFRDRGVLQNAGAEKIVSKAADIADIVLA